MFFWWRKRMAEQQLQEAGYSPIHFTSLFPISQYITIGPNLNKHAVASVGKAKAAPVENLNQLRAVLNGSTKLLILDLEFFQAGNQNHIFQLAGRVYNQAEKFNYYFFNSQQTDTRQLQFLRRYDVPFSQAQQFTVKHQLPRIIKLVDSLAPDYLVSWDNSQDFKALQRAANRLAIPKQNRFWNTVQAIDLEKLVAQQVWNGQKALGLKKMCQLLNLPPFKFHQAQHDVRAIEAILKFYSLDLSRELLV